jgi:hypothetical protein
MGKLVRRWHWWLPALPLVAWLGPVGYRVAFPPWTGRAAGTKYGKVYLGMPQAELEAVFGKDDYAGRVDEQGHTWPTRLSWRRPYGLNWQLGPDDISVSVGRNGKVFGKSATIRGRHFFESSDPEGEPSWWDRARARLG